MGCQCAKGNEKSNMNLETAPPKLSADVETKADNFIEPKEVGKNAQPETEVKHQPVQQVAAGAEVSKVDTVNHSKIETSKIENSKLDESKTAGKKKKKLKKAANNFNEDLLHAINNVRADPSAYASRIEEAILRIRTEEGKLIFEAEGTKIALVKGEEAFKAAANKIRGLPPSGPLEFRDDLAIPVPEDSKDWKKQEVIAAALGKRKSDNENKYTDYLFNMDLGVSDPEVSLLLQIVDDSPFKGKRCDNILNRDYKFIGISHQKQGKSKFCCYITIAR
jgi:hypothetical protein